MTDVFISYKREQRPHCARIAEKLRALGLDVWFDAKLESGTSFDSEIEAKIRAAKAVLVLWSPEAAKSAWVRNEATIGLERDVLVSVEIVSCKRPVQFTTTHTEPLHRADFADDDPIWQRVLARIGRLAGRHDLAARADIEDPPPIAHRRVLWPVAAMLLAGALGFGGLTLWRGFSSSAGSAPAATAAPSQIGAASTTGPAAASDPCMQARADWEAVAASNDVAVITAFRDGAPLACSVQRGLAQSRLESLAVQAAAAVSQRTASARVDQAFAGAWVGAEGRAGPCGRLPWRFERAGQGFRRIDAGGDVEPFELADSDPPTLRYAESGMLIVAGQGELAVIPSDNSERCVLRRQ